MLVVGLIAFGVIFALNSAVHSYLVLSYADNDKVAMNVGFYYMANAGGRLWDRALRCPLPLYGLTGCLWASAAFVIAAGVVSLRLPAAPRIVHRGFTPWLQVVNGSGPRKVEAVGE